MAEIYTVTLSDGSTTFSIYPLEANGPNNVSIPRQIQVANVATSFEINGDLTYRFVATQTFTVSGGGSPDIANAGTYTVAGGGSTYSSGTGRTTIPVVETGQITTAAPPLGRLQYSIPAAEEATSLTLPGRAYVNYGFLQTENIVHLLENFAGPTPPANPITGQHWFDTTTNTMNVFGAGGGSPAGFVGEGINVFEEGVLVQGSVLNLNFVGGAVTATQAGGSPANNDVDVTITAGGSDTELQYNNAGAFGGISTATFDGDTVTILESVGNAEALIVNSTGGGGSALYVENTVSGEFPIEVWHGDVGGGNAIWAGVEGVSNSGYTIYAENVASTTGGSLYATHNIKLEDAGSLVIGTGDDFTIGTNGTSLTTITENLGTLLINANNALGSGSSVTIRTEASGGVAHDTIVADNAFAELSAEGTLRLQTVDYGVDIVGDLTMGNGIRQAETSAVPLAVNPGAGQGAWWVRDDAPNVPIFTDDAGTDHNLVERVLPDYDAQIGGSPPMTTFTTAFSFSTPAAGKASLQVFVNGVKQKEASGGSPYDGNYTISAPSTVTFTPGAGIEAADDIEFYGFG